MSLRFQKDEDQEETLDNTDTVLSSHANVRQETTANSLRIPITMKGLENLTRKNTVFFFGGGKDF